MQIGLNMSLSGLRTLDPAASVRALFANDEPGVWFEANDATTLFTDVAGTTPVTTPGDAVALQLDKSGRGNHRTQATTAARPLYALHPVGGVRNLLQYTEEFNNVYWTKERLTASGTSLVPTAANGTHNLIRSYSKSGTASNYTVSGRATADGYNFLLFRIDSGAGNGIKVGFNISTGEVSNTAATNGTGWTLLGATITASPDGGYDFSISFTTDATTVVRTIAIVSNTAGDAFSPPSYTGDGTSGIVLEDFQLEVGSTATNYQRVGSFLDVSEEGKARRGRIWYNGTSHFMQTGTITPGTDKVQVFAGVRKLSDAAASVVIETSTNYVLNNGTFIVLAPQSASNTYRFGSVGSIRADVGVSGFAAPTTNVLSGLGDISGDSAILRVDGTQEGINTGDQGTGNYLAYPIYFGARAGTSLFFNGYEDTSIIRFGPNLDASVIGKVESYVASKTPEETI